MQANTQLTNKRKAGSAQDKIDSRKRASNSSSTNETEDADYKKGKKMGYNQARFNGAIPKNFKNKSSAYINGYCAGHAEALEIFPPEEREKNQGYNYGYRRGKNNFKLFDVSHNCSTAYIEGAKEGYAKGQKIFLETTKEQICTLQAQSKNSQSCATDSALVIPQTHEEKLIYENGYRYGYERGRKNFPLVDHFPKCSTFYIKGIHEGYAKGQADFLKITTAHIDTLKTQVENDQPNSLPNPPRTSAQTTKEKQEYMRGYKAGHSQGKKNGNVPNNLRDRPEHYREGYLAGHAKGLDIFSEKQSEYKTGYKAGYASGKLGYEIPDLKTRSVNYREGYLAGHAKAFTDNTEEQREYNRAYQFGYAQGYRGGNVPVFNVEQQNQSATFIKRYEEGYVIGKNRFDFISGYQCAHNDRPLEAELLAKETEAFQKGYAEGQTVILKAKSQQVSASIPTTLSTSDFGLFAQQAPAFNGSCREQPKPTSP